MTYILFGLVAAIVALMVYVRVAPSKAAQWHDPQTPMPGVGQVTLEGGYIDQRLVMGDGAQQMAALDQIIRNTPRTIGLAGTLERGKMTYITRSAVCGFPDFTTVSLLTNANTGEVALQVFGRLRFGRKDFAVNQKRIQGWLAQLDASD